MQIPRLITTKESRKIYGSIIAKKDGSSSKKKKKKGKIGKHGPFGRNSSVENRLCTVNASNNSRCSWHRETIN